jgi:UDP-2,3-diacylglucosamine pyrophosphatase LpxH
VLDNLKPTPKINTPKDFRPGVIFDGNEGTATTEGLADTPNFDDFLLERGYPPEEYEIIGTPRTSQWQQREGGDYLTSYRFSFRKKVADLDLPALFSMAAKHVPLARKVKTTEKALIICPADLQVGKADGSRGGTPELIERVFASYDLIEAQVKAGKYEHLYILDMGDIIESLSSKANMQQLQSNDLSPMQQTDLAASLMFELIKRMSKYAPITYGSIASNHCQNRFMGQTVGKPGLDDWGIVILQQLRRLTTEIGMKVDYLIPQPLDEGFAFQYGVNTIGAVHGHQASRPAGVKKFWADAVFGEQWLNATVDLLISAHFHHLAIEELGQRQDGKGSKFWVQCPTSDAGSDWYRRKAGVDSTTGILTIELDKHTPFSGTVTKH